MLRGRLEDAEFTFERDVEVGIDRLAERLASITYLKGAGSFADKTQRLVDTVQTLGGDDHAENLAGRPGGGPGGDSGQEGRNSRQAP